MKECKHCGTGLSGLGKRADAVYCSDSCQDAARYQRKKAKQAAQKTTIMEGVNQTPTTPIDNAGMQHWLQFQVAELQRQLAEERAKIKKLDAENEALKKQNFRQELELAHKDKEQELELKGIEVKQKSSLGGILETTVKNDNLMNLLGIAVGRMMGVDEQEALPPKNSQPPNEYIESLTDWFNKQKPVHQNKIWNLIVALSKTPDPDETIEVILNIIPKKHEPSNAEQQEED